MKTVIFAATAAALTVLAVPALAQDKTSFSGPRIEALTGYDSVHTNSNGLGKPDGLLYGAGVGYDIRRGNAVFGLDAEITDSTASVNTVAGPIDATRDLYIGGRAGVLIGPKALAYVKAGYSNARVEGAGLNQNGDGLRLGAGLEYDLGNKLFAKAEYRYTNYEQDVERHQLLGGVGVRF
jgi:outer membrane immunogenic protein